MEKILNTRQKITPFLWFDNNAEEAILFYTSVFKDSRIKKVIRNGAGGPGPAGTLLTASIELEGQEFAVINGGPAFTFTEAISFVVNCETQTEIDYYWEKLSAGGAPGRCGWLKDKFGLSWQIVPANLSQLLQQTDAGKAQRVMNALMQMEKPDLEQLQAAAAPEHPVTA